MHAASRQIREGVAQGYTQNLSAKRSPQLVPVTLQGGVGSRCPPARANRARCYRHEARVGIVALISCCRVRLGNEGLVPPDETALSSPACTQRSTSRGAALASHLNSLTLRGDKRGCSNALLVAVFNGTSVPDSELVSCSCEPDNWAYGLSTPETSAGDIISARISFSFRCAIFHCSIGFPDAWRTPVAIQRTPSRLVTTLPPLL